MMLIAAMLILPMLIAAAALALAIAAGNRLAALDARCATAFADVDVHLKRRAELVPGLVECVRGFAAHEATILGGVIEARRSCLHSGAEARQQVEATLGRKVGAVFSLVEKYPDLAASPHFRELRGELLHTEDRIAAARRFFNLAVEEYNVTLAQFPGSLLAARRRLAARHPFDLGIDRAMLDEPVTFRFTAAGGAA